MAIPFKHPLKQDLGWVAVFGGDCIPPLYYTLNSASIHLCQSIVQRNSIVLVTHDLRKFGCPLVPSLPELMDDSLKTCTIAAKNLAAARHFQ